MVQMTCLQYVIQLDQKLFTILSQWHHVAVDGFVAWVTHRFFWIPLYIFLAFFIKKNKGWWGLLLVVVTITLSDQCSATLLKPFFKRLRPCYEGRLPLVGEHIGIYGFPSSHASNTFAFAIIFWLLFNTQYRLTYLFFPWAAIISYGRIYGGVHYPIDIIGGAMLGSGIGLLMYIAYQMIQKNSVLKRR